MKSTRKLKKKKKKKENVRIKKQIPTYAIHEKQNERSQNWVASNLNRNFCASTINQSVQQFFVIHASNLHCLMSDN